MGVAYIASGTYVGVTQGSRGVGLGRKGKERDGRVGWESGMGMDIKGNF